MAADDSDPQHSDAPGPEGSPSGSAAAAGRSEVRGGPDLQRLGPSAPSCVLAGTSFGFAAMTAAVLVVSYVVLQQRPECTADPSSVACVVDEANRRLIGTLSQIGAWVLGTGAVVLFVSACVLWARENPGPESS